jgi:hypothetical protein
MGVKGKSDDSSGVVGVSMNSHGLQGYGGGGGDGVHGESFGTGGSGVAGINWSNAGVFGAAASGSNKAGVFDGGITVTNGSKSFVEPHPYDPEKEIRFVSLEGPENGTYFRGTGRLVGGVARIEVPEAFRMVTASEGLTVVAMSVGDVALLGCVKKSLDEIVIRGSKDVEFDYVVNGVRKAFDHHEPVEPNSFFVPTSPRDRMLTRPLPKELFDRLVRNGTLSPDGSVNMETVRKLGWDKRDGWRASEPEPLRLLGPPAEPHR